ncbi:MAG: glucose-6-phosphate isomerase [Fusobacteria bacterium]|nr:glucose-6-phosphate isomerase [Fusobacteriota bacterium]
MKKLSFDYSKAKNFINDYEIDYLKEQVNVAANLLDEKKGAGNDYVGWVDLPVNYNKDEFNKVKEVAKNIIDNADVLLVVGIGGSYLGSRAAIEFLCNTFYNNMKKEDRKTPEIYFIGHNMSSTYISHLFKLIEGKSVYANVISKSGTTTEPAIAFRIVKDYIEKTYGKEEAKKRIIATTDAKKGALKQLANEEGYETFVVPDDIGGRFSVLTPVGLLPIAVAGIDIDKLIEGAKDAYNDYKAPYENNDCYKYAAVRNALLRKGKSIEILVNYEPGLYYIAEWWKQLYGESEGKDGKGIFPAAVNFTTDLHSMGQYIQDGQRIIFETVLNVEKSAEEIIIKEDSANLDGLNYIAGNTIDYVNKKALEGTMLAHTDGNVPNIMINIPEATPYHLGYMFYFFEKACGISGYLLGVNPFDQPGVEAYKANMFGLLGKPGYEKLKAELEARLK